MVKIIRLCGLMLTLSVLAACSTNPVTGKSEFSAISPAQELAIGARQYGPSQQSQGGIYTLDPELSRYVTEVGQKLAAVSHQPDLPYEFVVLNNDVPNAWALPGGKIAINRGLMVHLEDEAQLAAVLGHEIVHAAARHSAQQMTQSMLIGIGGQLAVAAGRNSGYGDLVGTGVQLGSALYQASYGRDQELQADDYGMLYMARAGYEPEAAVELQQTFVRLAEGRQSNWLEGLFASHPPSQQRVDANRVKASKLTPGERHRQRYQRAMATVTRNQPAYELHQKAQKAASEKNFDAAQQLLQQAIDKQPREPLFYATAGQLELHNKRYDKAIKHFKRAHELYPEYFLPLLGRGVATKALGFVDRAEQDLIMSSKMLPTQAAAFYLGEIKLEQGDKNSAVVYFRQSAQGGGELGKRSQEYLQQLAPAATQQQ
ncbi:M48 family metalloprotease [Pseudomaricurvus alkylphenolicus]|uniref:M48 family metalloprotease n=1 Tax=Pseudomaricurvus alkylphenolicus TaxID=1306991 RepID=UPI00141E588B|nr:M48 family metalloprotease [Pseudomaricurvus alkylphenolicus]NIB39460.1 M48 family metalloprotease [Pseudomaricurvus alkylphenolicus]